VGQRIDGASEERSERQTNEEKERQVKGRENSPEERSETTSDEVTGLSASRRSCWNGEVSSAN
jgi:hypothetical protein